jgi:hypothetical protein
VWNASRSEHRFAWAQTKPLVADLDDVFSVEAVGRKWILTWTAEVGTIEE